MRFLVYEDAGCDTDNGKVPNSEHQERFLREGEDLIWGRAREGPH